MKDSQLHYLLRATTPKYIKANNERFSTEMGSEERWG